MFPQEGSFWGCFGASEVQELSKQNISLATGASSKASNKFYFEEGIKRYKENHR